MLNIDDIIKRDRLEPPQVADIRYKIIDYFSDLSFEEKGHKYTLFGNEIPSVSTVIHCFEKEKDWPTITQKYAEKNNMSVESVKRMWHEKNIKSTNNGTSTHLFGEAYMHFFRGDTEWIEDEPVISKQYEDGYLIPYSPKQEAICKFYEKLFEIEEIYPVMSEAMMYMSKLGPYVDCLRYAGTFDMLFTYKSEDKWKLLIYDWKTNEELFNPDNRKYGNTLINPFTDLVEEPFSLYTLQLSAYTMCLQQIGFTVADRKIIWLKSDGTFEALSVPDRCSDLYGALKLK